MPFVWIKDTNYLMGTHMRKVMMPTQKCMVSVGGGFMEISEYYDKESYGQSVALYRTIKSTNSNFKEILIGMIEKHTNCQKIVAFYDK